MAPFKAISGAGAAGAGLQPHAPSYWRWRSRSTSKATADYHTSLLDREDRRGGWGHDDADAPADDNACPPRPRTSYPTTTTTTTGTGTRTGTAPGRSSWALRRPSSSKSTKKSNPFRSEDVPELPPIAAEFSRRELAEFSALPIAIRRKYFCTLDQRRFAQTSTTLDDTEYNNNPTSSDLPSDEVTAPSPPTSSSQPCPSPLHSSHAVCADPVPLKGASPKPWQQEPLTREEQFVLARQLRQSVLLDAAEEAIYKTGQQAPRYLSPPLHTPTLSSTRPSMESQLSDTREPPAPSRPRLRQGQGLGHDNFYDSFRWLDEDDGLDLSLHLDDYHANLRDTVSMPAKEHRPSFRRHLSVNKIPFGRPSMTASRPATEESTVSPAIAAPPSAVASSAALPSATASSAVLPPAAPQPHARRKSRALSLISPRHGAHNSVTSIDPDAAHYQDPEAREKVRLYLGSSQKFDEAVAYGFPANDRTLPRTSSEPLQRRQSGQVLVGGSEKVETFYSDDHSSTYSEGFSVADPDTPMTPRTPERLGAKQPMAPSEEGQGPRRMPNVGALEAPLGSREMTLRMTLTRPDLRACEDQIYGWQHKPANPRSSRMSQASVWRDEFPLGGGGYATGAGQPKENYERFFADLDDETNSPAGDGNAVKRLWQRVRRGPRERARSKSSVTGL